MAKINKARFWTGVLYPENMKSDWKTEIGDTLQLPYAYCLHSLSRDSKSDHRKDHIHLIVAFPNTTTYKHAMEVMDLLSAEGKKAINTCQAVISIRNMYDYIIHDTEDCRKKGKEPYDASERITGNNFDIGSYEQIGIVEKNQMFLELGEAIRKHGFENYMDFYEFVVDTYDDINYIEIVRCFSGHFDRMLKGNFHRYEQAREQARRDNSPYFPKRSFIHNEALEQHEQQHETHKKTHKRHTKKHTCYCQECGSLKVKKNGKTLANTQRWVCRDCGKSFV